MAEGKNEYNMNLNVAKQALAMDLFCNIIFDADGRTDGQPVYTGYAMPGTGSGDAAWAVKKFTFSGSRLINVTWAGGTAEFDKTFTGRAGYSYS